MNTHTPLNPLESHDLRGSPTPSKASPSRFLGKWRRSRRKQVNAQSNIMTRTAEEEEQRNRDFLPCGIYAPNAGSMTTTVFAGAVAPETSKPPMLPSSRRGSVPEQDESKNQSHGNQRQRSVLRKKSGPRLREQSSFDQLASIKDEPGHLPAFSALRTEIPTSSIDDLSLPGKIDFTHRGSMLIGGRRANGKVGAKSSAVPSARTEPKPEPETMTEQEQQDINTLSRGASDLDKHSPRAHDQLTNGASRDDEKSRATVEKHLQSNDEEDKSNSTHAGHNRVPLASETTAHNSQDIYNSSGRRQNLAASTSSPILASSVARQNLSADQEALSNKVRSMYEFDSGHFMLAADAVEQQKGSAITDESQVPRDGNAGRKSAESSRVSHPYQNCQTDDSSQRSTEPTKRPSDIRPYQELAGGMEDWADVKNEDVDRYGFIVPRRRTARNEESHETPVVNGHTSRLHRVSTSLQLAASVSRFNGNRLNKTPSWQMPVTTKSRSPTPRPASESGTSRRSSLRGSIMSTQSLPSDRLRASRGVSRKDRQCLAHARNMLIPLPGLAMIGEEEEASREAIALKRRECEREDKWRRMGVVMNDARQGGGMVFSFNVNNVKVRDRTWKGIPDRWRATAWHSFLSNSAKRYANSASDEDLISTFRQLVNQASPDDVQIDLDVPRTINSHIMFRRRYRGGQRLLFRVLHCMSLFSPSTGYVQGMAALTATLLCYYEEEMAFVMLVRMWQLRGLEALYASGFDGLIKALDEFENEWLGPDDAVALRLERFGITATAYGTRWYLTLFNYSIPFPAQLRVWDVFMLLGDPDVPYNISPSVNSTESHSATQDKDEHVPGPISYNGGLDVLHACAVALIDGTRDVLMDSDFEDAMKILTSWIPIQDEETFMQVARVEWNRKRALRPKRS